MNIPCNQYPVKFVSCCDVMNCIDIHSDDQSVTITKSDCGVDLSVSGNNLDKILQLNSTQCFTFIKEFINGKLIITPVIDWNCVSGKVCPICSSGGAAPNLVFSWQRTAGDSVDISSSIDGTFSSVDWGDGTIDTLTTHTYATTGLYTVSIYDSTTTKLEMRSSGTFVGRIRSLTTFPSTVLSLIVYVDTVFSNLSVITSHTNLTSLRINNELGGLSSFPAFTALTALQSLTLIGYNSTVVNITNNTLLTTLAITGSSLTTVTGFNTAIALNNVSLGTNALPVSQVNSILQQLDTNGLHNGVLQLGSQSPAAAPTGAGLTAKTALIGKTWTVSTD